MSEGDGLFACVHVWWRKGSGVLPQLPRPKKKKVSTLEKFRFPEEKSKKMRVTTALGRGGV